MVPAVAQALDIVALVLGVVARLMAVCLQIEGVVPTGEDIFFKITHYSRELIEKRLLLQYTKYVVC